MQAGGLEKVIQKKIEQLLSEQKEKYAMPRELYLDKDIYEREVDRIFLNVWLYAGHHSEIPNPGDWFLFEFAGESVIIARSAEHRVSALLNVCRHRGFVSRTAAVRVICAAVTMAGLTISRAG